MQLRPYQMEDVNKLKDLHTAGLFNEQRTGKTPTILSLVRFKRFSKVIIVAPASTLYSWKEAYETWVGMPCIIIQGNPTKRMKAISNWEHGAVISYDTFKSTKKRYGEINNILKQNPQCIICDEAHRFKDPGSAVARAIFKTIIIPYRYALTGTPAPNKSHEIYSILYWLHPEKYSSYWGFIGKYFNIRTEYAVGRSFKVPEGFKKGKEIELLQEIQQYTAQRKRKEVMPWLPEKDYTRIKLEPNRYQKLALKELEQFFETGDVITQGILDRLLRYRQICLDPGLLNLKGNSPKTDWIMDYINDYPEKPIIIFSKFTTYLKKLSKIISSNTGQKHGMIIGETSLVERKKCVDDFQKGDLNILLLQIDAAKEGLTLDRGETTIFTDKYPPVGDIQQAEDRFVATTEDKKDKPHEIIELIIKGTYDEHIYDMLALRKSDTDILNDYKNYLRR